MPVTSARALSRTPLEVWTERLALGIMAIFTLLGFYVLFSPSDLLIQIYGAMLWVTLAAGLGHGAATLYA
jgi:hypothetical protein